MRIYIALDRDSENPLYNPGKMITAPNITGINQFPGPQNGKIPISKFKALYFKPPEVTH